MTSARETRSGDRFLRIWGSLAPEPCQSQYKIRTAFRPAIPVLFARVLGRPFCREAVSLCAGWRGHEKLPANTRQAAFRREGVRINSDRLCLDAA